MRQKSKRATHQGGLSCAIGANQANQIACPQFSADLIHNRAFPAMDSEILQAET
jgi:type IV pilus biogenesis protein CpaD/CtpE